MTIDAPRAGPQLRETGDAAMRVVGLTAWYAAVAGVRDISLDFAANRITAIIGCAQRTSARPTAS